jgi:hypothetical protein
MSGLGLWNTEKILTAEIAEERPRRTRRQD